MTVWPKILPKLTEEQKQISDDFMKLWHETLATHNRYGLIEKFNHGYATKNISLFRSTLEIGAGLGEHLAYETLSPEQEKEYVALELRENMAKMISEKFPNVQTYIGDCQQRLAFTDNHFDRILAIHVLEHLPNLPMTIKEMYRLCNKNTGKFYVVIPCEGGFLYSIARKISAQRIFEKRYKQSYRWFIEREHINLPHEIIKELTAFFKIDAQQFFPFKIPSVNFNLCIGMTLRPKLII